MIDLLHPANASLVTHFADPERRSRSVSVAKDQPSCAPSAIPDAYLRLGTHPDLLEHFWDELGRTLPVDCRWVLYGAPVLANPSSGVVFGFCGGTHMYALRLPDAARANAIAEGAKTLWEYPAYPGLGVPASSLDLKTIGPEWVFGTWSPRELEWIVSGFELAEGGG